MMKSSILKSSPIPSVSMSACTAHDCHPLGAFGLSVEELSAAGLLDRAMDVLRACETENAVIIGVAQRKLDRLSQGGETLSQLTRFWIVVNDET